MENGKDKGRNSVLTVGYICIVYIDIVGNGNAFSFPELWLWWRWWWGANLKAITPPYEFYYHHWLIIALGCGATRATAWCWCLSLWCGPIWSSCALVRTLRTFYGVLLCHTGQTELRLWDRNKKKREKKLMLINGEEWRRGEQNQISFMRIFTGPLLSFLFILFLQKREWWGWFYY